MLGILIPSNINPFRSLKWWPLVVVILIFKTVVGCSTHAKLSKIYIGSHAQFCIYIGPTNWNSSGHYFQLSMEVIADKLSKIVIPKSWTSQNYTDDLLLKALTDDRSPTGVGVTVGSVGVLSYQRIFREVLEDSPPTLDPTSSPSSSPTGSPTMLPTATPSIEPTILNFTSDTNPFNIFPNHLFYSNISANHNASNVIGVTFPILFGIVDVEGGHIKSIVWDNFCHWCSRDHCAANTLDYGHHLLSEEGRNCFVYDSQCIHSNGMNKTISSLCELTIYISWHGTDASGANFVSSSSRFSRWSSQQITNYTSSLLSNRIYIADSIGELAKYNTTGV